MRTWQVERRKRTRHLIELGGLVVKAGVVDLTGDDRATILGALLWIADKLQSDQGEQARALWVAKGKQAFDAASARHKNRSSCSSSSSLRHDNACQPSDCVPGATFEHATGAGNGTTKFALRQIRLYPKE